MQFWDLGMRYLRSKLSHYPLEMNKEVFNVRSLWKGGFHTRETQAENGAITKKSELINGERETRFLVMPLSQEIRSEAYRLQ